MTLRHATALTVALCFAGAPAFAVEDRQVLECAAVTDAAARLACYDALAARLGEARVAGAPAEEDETSLFGLRIGSWFSGGPADAPAPSGAETAAEAPDPKAPEGFGAERVAKAPQADAPEDFGAERIAKAPDASAPEPLESISSEVESYKINKLGRFVVELDNAQVWRQLDSDGRLAQFRRYPGVNRVTISRGFLDSYNLRLNDAKATYKVVRVK